MVPPCALVMCNRGGRGSLPRNGADVKGVSESTLLAHKIVDNIGSRIGSGSIDSYQLLLPVNRASDRPFERPAALEEPSTPHREAGS
jgi:hypothetical protein